MEGTSEVRAAVRPGLAVQEMVLLASHPLSQMEASSQPVRSASPKVLPAAVLQLVGCSMGCNTWEPALGMHRDHTAAFPLLWACMDCMEQPGHT